MAFTLNPRYPLLWRDTATVQFGLDDPVVIADVTTAHEQVLWSLQRGIAEQALPTVAELAGLDEASLAALMTKLEPALLPRDRPVERPAPVVALDGGGPLGNAIARLLAEQGFTTVTHSDDRPADASAIDAAVLIRDFAIAPRTYGWWLRRDIPHLAVTLRDASTRVGPLVIPGDGPCLYCADCHAMDADTVWPVLATQLLAHAAPEPSTTAVMGAALVAADALRELADGEGRLRNQVVTVDGLTGATRSHPLMPHPRCQCGAQPENVTPIAQRGERTA